jgi:two-component sensor histidine kinase
MTLPEEGKDPFLEPGYELVKQQLFFRKELIERVHWFIRVRWFAVGGAVAGAWALHLLEPKFPLLPFTLIALGIFLYNLIFRAACQRLDASKGMEVRPFTTFAHIQISLDLLALYGMIYFTGGIYSPLLMFVIFHIIIAGLLLAPLACYLYSFSSLLATAALVGLVQAKILPEQPILLQSSLFPHLLLAQQSMKEVMLLFAFFGAAVLITAFLITTIRGSLWTKGQDLLKVSKDLDASNAKLTALYEVVKRMGLCADLKELLDLATRSVASIMGVKGSSIKLLDETRRKLIFSSTYGLSENYLAKGTIDIEKSPINRRIIEGSFVAMGRIDEQDYFQYPEDIRKEGIASMVCLPLRVEKMPLGVFCMYSEISYDFSENDIKFFSLLSDLTALAIETLRGEINKTWFLQKAAHQLRSPFSAIYSLMKVLRKGYLGPVSEQQQDAILRCEKRLEILGTMVNDLLKLGIKRQHQDRGAIQAVNGVKVLKALEELYGSSASEKGVAVDFVIDQSVPELMADEKLLDELFGNLISNAIKYTPSAGKVRVSLAPESEHRVRFEVSDTGIGIPEEDIPRLFTEFFRAENAKAQAEEGTGLGLVIVKEILDFLGGSISVKSKVGEGTTLTCLLPSV